MPGFHCRRRRGVFSAASSLVIIGATLWVAAATIAQFTAPDHSRPIAQANLSQPSASGAFVMRNYLSILVPASFDARLAASRRPSAESAPNAAARRAGWW